MGIRRCSRKHAVGAPVVLDFPLQAGVPPHCCQWALWEDNGGREAAWRFLLSRVLLLAEIPDSKGQVRCCHVRPKQGKSEMGLVLTPLRFMAF